MKTSISLVSVVIGGYFLLTISPKEVASSVIHRNFHERIEFDSGYKFNVWAPNANGVSVVPTGGNPSWKTTPLVNNNGYWSAEVSGVQPGNEYVFEITLSSEYKSGNETVSSTFRRIDPKCSDISADGTYSIVPEAYTFRNARVNIDEKKAFVYELHVGSFTAEGTFAAASDKLDFLAGLGVNVIELMPVMHFCGDPKGWGYDPCAPFAVKPELGGSVGLKKFVDAAADKGMAVAMDVVFNHASGDTLLKDYDGPTTNSADGIYFYDSAKGGTPWGPRYDYSNAIVRDYLVSSVEALIEQYHISFFRWDSTMCIRYSGCSGNSPLPDGWRLMQDGNRVKGNVSGVFTVAEDSWGGSPDPICSDVGDTSASFSGVQGGAGFSGKWAYQWHYATLNEITKGDNTQIDVSKLMSACATPPGGVNMPHSGGPGLVLFSENHDTASNQNSGRVPNMVDDGGGADGMYWAQKKAMLAMGMVFTCRGMPMLLQGQEILTFAAFDFPVPPVFDWSRTTSFKGMVQQTTDMAALRVSKNGATDGLAYGAYAKVLAVSHDAGVGAVLRSSSAHNGGDIIVVYHYQKTTIQAFALSGVPQAGTYAVVFNGDDQQYSSLYDNACSTQKSIDIAADGTGSLCVPPMSMLVLAKQNS
eukprot:m.200286 g.200286  ORF g.200286 m.200286 type:complete len:643 (-) comp18783_c0_seq1:159-2087(-)